jgi:hypothetical protein
MTEHELAVIMQPKRMSISSVFAEPDFNAMQQELGQKGMIRQLLWEEYAETHPSDHYRYSRFTVLFKQGRGKLQLSIRQTHLVGEKLFVDYCGPTMKVVNPETGEYRTAQVFVAVLEQVLIPLPKQPGHKNCLIGSVRMCEPLISMEDYLKLLSLTISEVLSVNPVVMIMT